MATGADVVADVRVIFGDTLSTKILDADYVRWINDAQLEIYRHTEFDVQTMPVFSSTVGVDTYPLPVDFLKFNSVTWSGKLLILTTEAQIDLMNPNRKMNPPALGRPSWYYRENEMIIFYPPPMDVQPILIQYVPRPVMLGAITDDLSVPDEMVNDIKQFLLSRSYEVDDNTSAADSRMQNFKNMMFESRDQWKFPSDKSYPSVREIEDHYY